MTRFSKQFWVRVMCSVNLFSLLYFSAKFLGDIVFPTHWRKVLWCRAALTLSSEAKCFGWIAVSMLSEARHSKAYEWNAASKHCGFNSIRKRGYRKLCSYFCVKNHLEVFQKKESFRKLMLWQFGTRNSTMNPSSIICLLHDVGTVSLICLSFLL